jgi:cytosine/adenosine deaminase-related metal-dependent hydrolase
MEVLMCELCRRDFMRATAALGTVGSIGGFSSPLMAQAQRDDGGSRLPARLEFTIRNAHVITMDPALGDIAGGSVHVRDGAIVAVGKDVAGGGERIDGTDMVVMPGLIDTHWHMWNTLFRSFSGDKPEDGYFPTVARFGAQMTPDDVFQGTRLAAAEAINSGMTFVHSWCHNVRSTAHAESDVRALAEVGIRGRHSCGWPQGLPDTQAADQAPIESLARNWASWSNGGLITLGMAWRGQFRAGSIAPAIYQAEFDNARKLGLPITVHVASARKAVGQIEPLFRAKLMGADVQLIHTLSASSAELDMIRESGSPVSVSPGSELRIGYGYPQIGEMLDKGIPLGVSVDTAALTGNASLFGVLKLARDSENAKAESEFKMTARQALELGTIAGARSIGLGDRIG